MKLRIRQAGERDLPLIVRYNCLMASETEGITLEVDTVSAGVRSVLEEPSRGFYVLAEARPVVTTPSVEKLYEDDGTFWAPEGTPSSPPPASPTPVGQLMVTYEWSDWRCGDFWWIQSVYVEPSWRRRGVFKALFDHVLQEAEKRVDVVGLRLYTATTNNRARSVYKKLGMDGNRYVVYELEKEDIPR
jgi:GNAT superfamily N-acetyltransferase